LSNPRLDIGICFRRFPTAHVPLLPCWRAALAA
jgi:hypothetical protein